VFNYTARYSISNPTFPTVDIPQHIEIHKLGFGVQDLNIKPGYGFSNDIQSTVDKKCFNVIAAPGMNGFNHTSIDQSLSVDRVMKMFNLTD